MPHNIVILWLSMAYLPYMAYDMKPQKGNKWKNGNNGLFSCNDILICDYGLCQGHDKKP